MFARYFRLESILQLHAIPAKGGRVTTDYTSPKVPRRIIAMDLSNRVNLGEQQGEQSDQAGHRAALIRNRRCSTLYLPRIESYIRCSYMTGLQSAVASSDLFLAA